MRNILDLRAPIGQEQRIKELMEILDELDPDTETAEEIASDIWVLTYEEEAKERTA
jgi:hypothetical protein